MWTVILILVISAILLRKYLQKPSSQHPLITPSHPDYEEIQKELINSLPISYEVPQARLSKFSASSIEFIETLTDSHINHLKSSKFLGIDTEEFRKNTYTGSICLIQISTNEKTFIIDTLSNPKEILKLTDIFLDSNITKIFHGCVNDTQWLQRDFNMLCVNVFDTQLAAKSLKIQKLGLNSLWEKYCEVQMSSENKKKLQLSDWSSRPLSQEQIEYAALDSFFLIYLMKVMIQELNDKELVKIRKETNKICLERFCIKINSDLCHSLFKENFPGVEDPAMLQVFSNVLKFLNDISKTHKQKLSDLAPLPNLVKLIKSKSTDLTDITSFLPSPYLSKFTPDLQHLLQPSSLLDPSNKSLLGSALRKQQKQERYQNFLKKYTITGKVFENCQIQLPNGEILCYSNSKKAYWYIDRSLATIITKEPLVVRLNFEPNIKSGVEMRDRKFFIKEKNNECVVCGSSESFLRYRVVPLLYRQYFPSEFKNFCRHDVLLLCATCHEQCNKHAELLKRKVAEDYQVPLYSYLPSKKIKEQVAAIRKVCVSLIKNFDRIPEVRKEELFRNIEEFVKEVCPQFEKFWNKSPLQVAEILADEKIVKEINGEENGSACREDEMNFHGKLVMEKVKDIKGFVYLWKRNFVEKMQPKFLPGSWKEDELLGFRE